MKKTTSQKLSKRLAQYGALSVAIAGVADVNGQIVYSGPINVGGLNVGTSIDFNSDANPDFAFQHFSSANVLAVGAYNSSNVNSIFGFNYVSTSGTFQYPFALNGGVIISNSMAAVSNIYSNPGAWVKDGFQSMNWGSCNFSYSQWCGATDQYLGLRFTILNGPGTGDDEVYFGWARLDVDLDAGFSGNWILKDWAYNSTDTNGDGIGDPITTGQTVLGIEDNILSKIKIVTLSKSIGLYNLPASSNYNLYNMTGQEVLNGTTNQREYVIEASTLASGVYIVELGDANSNAIIRKKVVLQ